MSKKNKKALKAEAPAGTRTVVTEKKAACRLFSFLFLLVSAAALILLPYSVVTYEAGTSLYKVIFELVQNGWFLGATESTLILVYNIALYVFAAFLAIAALLSLICLFNGKRGLLKAVLFFLDVGTIIYTICYIIAVESVELVSLILAIAMLVATVVAVLVTRPKIEVIEEEVEEVDDGFEVEEYAEAYPYEGGPVAGVVMAEEVNPSFIPQEPHVNTAGYDFYNTKSFDPFIATLTAEERNEFTEIFILKYRGPLNELPDYEVGGDNKEFFRKVFIYLGQYRDRIPSGLLGKIYQYTLKL